MGVGHDWLQWGFTVCCAWLVFLAGRVSANIFFCKFFHSSAFICLAKEVCCVGDSGVSHKWVIMVQLQDVVSHFEVFRELNLGEVCQW